MPLLRRGGMRCVFCRAYRSKPGHRLLSAGCTLLSTVRAQSALRAGAVAHGHYYSTRRARVCQGGFTNFSQKNGGGGRGVGGFCPPLPFPFFLPRGRGPSQTPPSLATDSSISPGPPSPWLPALLIGNLLLSFLLNPGGHRNRVANHAPGGGLVPGGVRRGEKPGNEHKCRFRETIKNREKFWGVWGTLSRVPRRISPPVTASAVSGKQ